MRDSGLVNDATLRVMQGIIDAQRDEIRTLRDEALAGRQERERLETMIAELRIEVRGLKRMLRRYEG